MADAVAVIEAQQVVVGRSLVGSSSAVVDEGADSQKGILEQIRDISLKTFRATREQVETFKSLLQIEKDNVRREREQRTEFEREKNAAANNMVNDDLTSNQQPQQDNQGGSFFAFLGGLPGAGLIGAGLKKLSGFFKIFAVGGVLGRFLSVAGPIGLIIGGITILTKYSDELVAAMKPVLEGLKKLAPVFDPVFSLLDTLIKFTIKGIGVALEGIIGDINDLIDGIKNIFTIDGFEKTLFSLFKLVFAIPTALIRIVSEPLGNLFNNLSKSWDAGVQSIHDYFASLPGMLLEGVRSFFKPVTDFFTTMKVAIRSAINNLIDTLPIPNFVKEKIKLEPSDVTQPALAADGSFVADPGVRVETTREPETVTELVREINTIRRTQNVDQPTMLRTDIEEPNMDALIQNYKNTRDSIQAMVNKYGFSDIMVGDPNYEADLAKLAEEMNTSLSGSGDAMIQAYTRFKNMVSNNQLRLNTLDMEPTDFRLTPPDVNTPKIQISKGVKGVTADLSGETAPVPPVTIINQPINQASNASNTSNTVSSTPLKTITDPYFDRESFNGNY